MELLIKHIHVRNEYKFGRKEVDFQSLKYFICENKRGNERKIYSWLPPRLIMST
jgi:hypothetical protein